MQEKREIFSKRLRQARLTKELTQQDLANALGISLRGYVFYEQAQREPNIEILVALADLLDVSLDWLLGLTDSEA